MENKGEKFREYRDSGPSGLLKRGGDPPQKIWCDAQAHLLALFYTLTLVDSGTFADMPDGDIEAKLATPPRSAQFPHYNQVGLDTRATARYRRISATKCAYHAVY